MQGRNERDNNGTGRSKMSLSESKNSEGNRPQRPGEKKRLEGNVQKKQSILVKGNDKLLD